eukprot:TRINITY_DN1782_c0_g1_i5.p1 TRINITY_DN1782_c0_g1~~TRINITY_DN1782_c0_g1_i5.p1  ORF type:complete len:640 (+),score=151.14 TRINITY_DN1782_c0_g1_i5:90-2009(+)
MSDRATTPPATTQSTKRRLSTDNAFTEAPHKAPHCRDSPQQTPPDTINTCESPTHTDASITHDELLITHDKDIENIRAMQSRRKSSLVGPADINVLLVDDDEVVLRIVQSMLLKSGYRSVQAFKNGADGLSVLMKAPLDFQLIILDIDIPDKSGLEILDIIRTNPNLKDVPVVMMSATEELDVCFQSARRGADDFLIKPIRQPVVQNLWQNVWRKRREKRLFDTIEIEKNQRENMEVQMKVLTGEISKLQQQISEVVETPLEAITHRVTRFIHQRAHSVEVQALMEDILKALKNVEMHRPVFAKFLVNEEIRNTTQTWLAELLPNPNSDAGANGLWSDIPRDVSNDYLISMRQFDFDVFQYTEDQILLFAKLIFQDFDLVNKFNIPVAKLDNFLLQIKNGYCYDNPYHNFRHAFDVLQMAYWILTSGGAAVDLTSLDILTMVIVCLGHDLQHPGQSNAYHIQARSYLAVRYNDKSVLESHHASTLFSILEREDSNILCNLTADQYKEVRASTIRCILATDLSKHMRITSKFESIAKSFCKENKEHRLLFMSMIVKCADISNACRPFITTRYWSDLVQEEFFRQGDLEKERGLTVSPFMDRSRKDQCKMVCDSKCLVWIRIVLITLSIKPLRSKDVFVPK